MLALGRASLDILGFRESPVSSRLASICSISRLCVVTQLHQLHQLHLRATLDLAFVDCAYARVGVAVTSYLSFSGRTLDPEEMI